MNSRTEQDSELKEMINEYNDSPYFNEVIGFSHLKHEKSQVGCFITEALRKKIEVDLTFQNTGGIRADLGHGDITTRNIFEILPFNNSMVIYKMTVSEIKSFLIGSGSGFYYSGIIFENIGGVLNVKDLDGRILPMRKYYP